MASREQRPTAVAAATSAEPAAEPAHLPLLEEATDAAHLERKPTWRGWIHAVTAPIAAIAGLVLVALASDAEARWACVVFALTSILLFGNSALYHRVDWSPRVKLALKRVDHANIFLLIAGTYTPLSLLALPPAQGVVLLAVVWAGALIGIAFRVFWVGAPRWLYVPIYLGLGWAAVVYFVPLFEANAAMMVLVVVGGLLYTVGALAYGFKRPNPFPGRFGFHEIFHTCTVLAFLCHWTATLLIALHPVA
ncbi:PAQR family membrane homeostasis protein TrhA [Amnibacterium setariae]|uniref:Hemolysin III family protein n=1 Tax=Amnibacterium setariae TaxID=2306585 RepID=A0A3A1U1V1_9MICO|nr:hemolysin III family protein [Amnibacterium setariae]RIX30895.1 hemolysin III family protein [Amnibacterium setariae]